MGRESIHWRTGTWEMTWSTRWAAVCAMRRAPEAVDQDAAFEERVELVLDELRQVGAGLSLGLHI